MPTDAEESPQPHHANPANWNSFVYFCKSDPRLWVPKANPLLGHTINFGHPQAPPYLLAAALAPTLLLALLRRGR